MSDDLRDDKETRCELHQQVDDLRERLWNICDERKEQAEKERSGKLDSYFVITINLCHADRGFGQNSMYGSYSHILKCLIPPCQPWVIASVDFCL